MKKVFVALILVAVFFGCTEPELSGLNDSNGECISDADCK